MGTDQFDDFEFRPLTEGLGFNKKVESNRAEEKRRHLIDEQIDRELPTRPADPLLSLSLETNRPGAQSLDEMMSALPPSIDFLEDDQIEEKSKVHEPMAPTAVREMSMSQSAVEAPTPQRQLNENVRPMAAQPVPTADTRTSFESPVEYEEKTRPIQPVQTPSSYKRTIDESFERAFPKAPARRHHAATEAIPQYEAPELNRLKEIPCSFVSGMLDTMVVAGLSLLFLVSLLAITNVDLIALLFNASTAVSAFVQLSLLFCFVTTLYYLTARGIFGATLGDWAFDQQLGTDDDRAFIAYPILVLWRSVLNTITGFIFFPVLSKIWGKDILGVLSGLKLQQRY